jgi:lipid II:glycine glycyltransferase (peptidoglycan interpeptide bridge formation enzyme)
MTEAEIIEIMARAICQAQGKDPDGYSGFGQTRNPIHRVTNAEALNFVADQIFESLKSHGLAIVPIEPTEVMETAGLKIEYVGVPVAEIYRAMIEAAQKERETA